jgi:hypothetical protein
LPHPGWATAFPAGCRRCFDFGMALALVWWLRPTRRLVRCHPSLRSPHRIEPGHAPAAYSGRSVVREQA